MNYNSTISLEVEKPKDLFEIFEPELKSFNDRSSYNITIENDKVIFNITAKDSVSLRSTLNSITKLLTVYEKLEKVE